MRITGIITHDEFAGYFICRKLLRATNENSNFDLKV